MKEYFKLYNVTWIVCWFDTSKRFFDRYPEYLLKRKEIDKFSIYQVKRDPSFFLKGKGTVTSDYNRIRLDRTIADNSEIILSYHWMKGLKTKPERRLERVFIGNDPIGFIRITDPPDSLLIYNGY